MFRKIEYFKTLSKVMTHIFYDIVGRFVVRCGTLERCLLQKQLPGGLKKLFEKNMEKGKQNTAKRPGGL